MGKTDAIALACSPLGNEQGRYRLPRRPTSATLRGSSRCSAIKSGAVREALLRRRDIGHDLEDLVEAGDGERLAHGGLHGHEDQALAAVLELLCQADEH